MIPDICFMKHILLFGAGKSATVLIDYLLANAKDENWMLTVADANLELALSKIDSSPHAKAVSFDITDATQRAMHIQESDIVISMLPPTLHRQVAEDCVSFSKHLLTASYVDEDMRKMEQAIKDKQLIFLCEMGLDPGIDHMSAMKIIDEIHAKGGKIISFKSHCGGLVAPESDDNPWHYKISWNPRNIIMAGKAGAHYIENGKEIRLRHEELFTADHQVEIDDIGYLSWYPNRDSLSYAPLYSLQGTPTFIRTTLRHPDFMQGWKNVIDLKLTDETPAYDSNGKSLYALFKEHMDKNGFGEWLNQKLVESFSKTKEMLENLLKLSEAEKEAVELGEELPASFMTADDKGRLKEINVDKVKDQAASYVLHNVQDANLTLKQLFFLGMDDKQTLVNKGFCSPADLLQFAVEKKLALQAGDKDMIVMLHEFGYTMSGEDFNIHSSLVVKGEDSLRTAMAKTVGLPLGIATKLILRGQIRKKGLQIPIDKEIYEPVLKELESYGVKFKEKIEP